MSSPKNTSHPLSARKTISLVMSVHDIPFEGLQVESADTFGHLYEPDEEKALSEELKKVYADEVKVSATVIPVRESKVDVRGECATLQTLLCDRCSRLVKKPMKVDISTFLMPVSQFSTHDKPGGKVIHGPKRETKPSRHHSHSKAEILTDAEGEHEDLSFGAFDGDTVDLRKVVREQLVLQIPMSNLCQENCHGLCVRCGENVDDGACQCKEGPEIVRSELKKEPPLVEGSTAFGAALKSKIIKNPDLT